ncbi:MAG: Asp-tRNA(Asn)/Glu-tRNA(Gln) amidotransferase subunit GatA [Verrucomicrobia bacterium]|nr:Asp-tRNA(Asn)/Glu-tRNA(Gln) amidotransferase subunit GatA [Verrucomicrobiota bacterium]
MDLAKLTMMELRGVLRKGKATSVDVVEAIRDAVAERDPRVGGYIGLDFETALAEARTADAKLPMGGIPVAIKDLINVNGQPCSCGSRMLAGTYRSPYDATVIRKLREAGAIPLGRTNMDEFAMGSSTENSGIQLTRNPWDLDRSPGGSSGGAAAVVAADMALASLGSDTGGSIRQPASFCGVVGLKPTYGRVSRYGVVAFASSLDQIGPITKTVEDAALLLGVIAGEDPKDSTTLRAPVPDYVKGLGADLKGMRVGLPKEYFIGGTAPGVRAAVDAGIRKLEELGAELVEVSLPHTEPAVAVYYILATAEASANLARFDGVRYGHRAENVNDLAEHYRKSRSEGFGAEVKRRIILGTYVLSSGYHDQYYTRAQQVRTLIRRDFEEVFAKVDIIASPASPTTAFRIGELANDPLHMYLADVFTIAANLGGICGLSIPCGFSESMPVGMQLLGPALGEGAILKAAHAYEKATEWHKQRPNP